MLDHRSSSSSSRLCPPPRTERPPSLSIQLHATPLFDVCPSSKIERQQQGAFSVVSKQLFDRFPISQVLRLTFNSLVLKCYLETMHKYYFYIFAMWSLVSPIFLLHKL